MRLVLAPGSIIVFEGLDRTGKTTQLSMLKEVVAPGTAVFAHMPSGFSTFTEGVYHLLESRVDSPISDVARQLAHLACHAESVPLLLTASEESALVLDRWWWSTLAYGWFGGAIEQSGVSEASFLELISSIWSPIQASIVLVFLEPHQADDHNNSGVAAGYRALISGHPHLAEVVSAGDAETTHSSIVDALVRRGLARQVDES